MDTDCIREDFPLTQEVIYLDNASTSLSPKPVIDAMLKYETHYRANVGVVCTDSRRSQDNSIGMLMRQ